MTASPADSHLLVEVRGRLGILTLNRPQDSNAISLGMIRGISAALAQFVEDSAVHAVLIRGSGRAFSSGGDVVTILGHPPGPEFERYRRAYFSAEYALNYRIHTFPKPYIALVDGLTIGGGCGLSLHGSHIVATERTLLSMPETGIGHFPDAGGSWFLNRMPGEMGIYAGLRGLRLNGADSIALGLATHFVRSVGAAALIDTLAGVPALDRPVIDTILADASAEPGASAVAARQARVDTLFGGATVETIVSTLEAAGENWAAAALEVLRNASPLSLKVTLRMLRAVRGLPITDALRTEYRICVRITGGTDFREGVRAALIDKDGTPQWRPDRLEAVDDQAVAACFAPLAPGEPELELAGS